ncbi:protein of unknown function [Tepidibacter aestuarii]|nr:protein of unknown function [Tepidibacter aestuarii]
MYVVINGKDIITYIMRSRKTPSQESFLNKYLNLCLGHSFYLNYKVM